MAAARYPRADSFFERHATVRSLRHRDFRLLFAGSTLVGLVMPLQFITQTFWVQDTFADRQVLYVSLLAGVRGAATLIFSLVGGAIADRYERRRVLLVCETVSFVLNIFIAALMLTTPFGEGTIIAIAALTFVAASNQAIDLPARHASIPAVVGMDDLSNAISLNQVAVQLAIPLTIPLAGILNGPFDPGWVYASSLVAWLGILPLIAALRFRSTGGAVRGTILRNIGEGLRYVRRDRVIFPVMSLFFVMQVIGMVGPGNLGVVWVTDVLEVSRFGFAIMAIAWGGGAVIGSVYFARRPELAGRGTTLIAMTLLFGVAAVVFGHSRIIPLTWAANLCIGFAIAGTAVSASSIVQHHVSEEMRGRVMGLFPLTAGLMMANTAPVGAIGQVVGLPVVMPILGWITLTFVALIALTRPALRTIRPKQPATAASEAVEPLAAAGGGAA